MHNSLEAWHRVAASVSPLPSILVLRSAPVPHWHGWGSQRVRVGIDTRQALHEGDILKDLHA